MNDETLMSAVGGGDMGAFEELVRRHQETAWRIAYGFLNDAAEAEDVAQDAFLRLLVAAPRYRPTAQFRTFLRRIVSRLCIDRARKMKPVYLDAVPDTPDAGPGADDRLADQERAAAIRRAVQALPPAQRMAVVLRYDEDLDYRAIADAMDTTEKAVERLLARARVALKGALGRFSADQASSRGGFGPFTRL